MCKYALSILLLAFSFSLNAQGITKEGLPDISVNWIGKNQDHINIKVKGKDPIMQACLKSGSILKYKYEIQICKRRPAWFDNCQKTRELKQFAIYDPISRDYQFTSQWDNNLEKAEKLTFQNIKEIQIALRTYKNLNLNFIANDLTEYVTSQRSYVSIRVKSECKSENNQALENLSQLLSFGLEQLEGFNTGWIDFHLRSKR
jgi:hypothetical protein